MRGRERARRELNTRGPARRGASLLLAGNFAVKQRDRRKRGSLGHSYRIDQVLSKQRAGEEKVIRGKRRKRYRAKEGYETEERVSKKVTREQGKA